MRISLHAVERFAQRALKIDNELPVEDKARIQKMIKKIIVEECPQAVQLKDGTYPLPDYGCKLVIKNGQVVTVKNAIKDVDKPSFLVGGIRKSGRKVKKFLQKQRQEIKRKDSYYE